ncbi:MAG TPA: ABC transporter ATP-binding protein [Cytophagales bacterium]|nr:ABC transporter ATP-binding protein [Cytophagales bacterium]HAA17887.1 ABC transporter ATP-binding protein [Cytophagales bacterium]HAP58191.1 ABC transporter ATP-binding protein [Cytophagales bacterium]
MIEVNNINKSFAGKQVLFDISGRFEKGRTNLIIGSSGTGKSVLLKCIVGLVTPEEGRVYFNERNFLDCDIETKTEIRREIGMLFQGGALFDSMSVEQNVMFPLNILTKMPLDEKQDRVNHCLKRVGLENVNKRMTSEISGGMKKRVGIARAIVNNSRYLFCDEPNSGLDPLTAIKIDNLIQEITTELDITTIVVTHDMNSVLEIGDNIMFMYKGRKAWEGTSEEILDADVEEVREFVYAGKFIHTIRERTS